MTSPDIGTRVRDRFTLPPTPTTYGGIFAVSLTAAWIGTAFRLVWIRFGAQHHHPDAATVWLPTARAVVDGGVELYAAGAVDNKPPLFHFLNLGAYLTGHYWLAWAMISAVIIAIATTLTVGYARQHFTFGPSLLAGGLFFASVAALEYWYPSARIVATVGLLAALVLAGRPASRGAWYAIGGLFSQWILFAAPVLLWREYKSGGSVRIGWFVLGGLATAATAYLAVGVFWGADAILNAVDHTMVSFAGYSSSAGYSPLGDWMHWGFALLRSSLRLSFVLIPALVGGSILLREGRTAWQSRALLLAMLLLAPFALKAFFGYWVYSLPFVSTLAAVGVAGIFTTESDSPPV